MKGSSVALSVYWIALVLATHYPTVQIPGEFSYRDKVVHFGAFALLALLVYRVVATRARAAAVWLTAVVLVPYAALDEYTQQFVGRDTDLLDWFADVGGIALALAALAIGRRRAARPTTAHGEATER